MPVGRPKGSSSAYSLKMRTTIAALLDKKADDIERWLDDIEANEGPLVAMKVVQDLLEYAMPKMARIEHTGADGDKLEITQIVRKIVDDKPD